MQFGNYLDEFLSRRSYVKLLRVLVLNSPAKEWSGREIARAAGIDHTVANDSLHIFNDCGMVSMRRLGNANVYRINAHHLVVRQFRRLFEAEQLAKEKLKTKLAKACASNKNILLATIYNGVNGRGNASSDIDLLVIVNEKTDLTELFRGVKTEFGKTVSLHVWTLEQLRTKRKLPLVRDIVKDGEHVYGGKLGDILRGCRGERMKPNKVRPLLLAGLLLAGMFLSITSAPTVHAQVENNYAVQSEPDPLMDGTSQVGSKSDSLSDAQTQDYIYEDISEANVATSATTTYDFSSGAGIDKWAKTNLDVDETNPPYTTTHFDNNPPEGAWTEITYTNIQSLNQVWQIADATVGDYSALQYKLTINEPASTITRTDITQTVYVDSIGSTIGVWVWNFTTSVWDQVGTNYTVNSGASPGETFTRSVTSGFSNYIRASDNIMYVIVVGNISSRDYFLDYIKFVVTYTPLDYRLNWEHRITGISSHDKYYVRIYGYADASETFSIKVWNGSTWVDNGYNLPTTAAWVDYQIPSSWVIEGAVSIKYDDDTDGDTTAQSIHIDYCGVKGATATFDFSVSASPNTLTFRQNESATSTISVSPISGEGDVSLSGAWIRTAPTGISTFFSPQSGTPPFSSVLTFTASLTASGGTFIYKVTGSGGGLTRTDTITLMLPPATPLLVSPENGTAIDTITPTFDWADVSGAESYTLQVATDNDFSYTIFSKHTVESTTASPAPLSYGTRYYWKVRAKNDVGTGDWSSTWEFTAKLTAPKVLSFEIEAGSQYTNSTSVELTISALNAMEMQFSNDGLVWGEWEPYQMSKSYTLEPPDGPKNIYIKVRDNVGDVGQVVLDSIILDQTPPSTAHSLSGELGNFSYKSPVVVTLTSTDAYGVESNEYRINNGEWQTGSTFVISSEGTHTIEYYSTDKAGNVEEIKSFEVAVHTSTIIPYFGPLIEEILNFLHQMGPTVLIILGFAVVIAGMTKSLVALVGVGLVICGLLILIGFL